MEDGYKSCPYCAEPIRIGARLCRDCNRKLPQPTPRWRWALYSILGAGALSLFFFNLGRKPHFNRLSQKAAEDVARARVAGVPDSRQGIAQSQLQPEPPPPPSPVLQEVARGNFVVPPKTYISFRFTVPQGAVNAKVKGVFHAFGGSGNDIQAVIANPFQFENWINGHQAQVLYGTERITNGTIDVEGIAPGDYILAFNNKFSAFSKKQVTALIGLSYLP